MGLRLRLSSFSRVILWTYVPLSGEVILFKAHSPVSVICGMDCEISHAESLDEVRHLLIPNTKYLIFNY